MNLRELVPGTIIAAAILGQPASGAESNYICLPEMATGFAVQDNGTWTSVDFRTDEKFLVRPLRGDELQMVEERADATPYGVYRVGEEYAAFLCADGFRVFAGETVLDVNFVRCDGAGEFIMSAQTLRYTRTYIVGWHSQSAGDVQERGNTPLIEIGSCSPL